MDLKEKRLADAYLSVLSFLENEPTGSEACLVLSPSLTPIECGYQYPPDDEDKLNVEKMLPEKEKAHDFAIDAGDYHLEQLEQIPEEGEIESKLAPYVASGSTHDFYLRMIKENALVVVIQLIWVA